ncbi:MAG: saccharopine dehydrogenase NADP-binding domain-containing protein, partial [Chitinophagales bacterium]|nr:saccharopine dehydrogenase NADP-binding domain-containing protein [Hyphomicrobiales bacterium]
MQGGRLRVLIIGGYGVFGGRLAQLLADEPRLTLIIAGRSKAKAEAFCASLTFKAEVITAALDRESDLDAQFAAVAPNVVVDATGPWQNYKGDVYRVLRASLRAGADYMDLADGSDFVRVVTQFDEEAKSRGVYALAGVSSFPVLTAAVVRRLAKDLVSVDHIAAGIAPSPYAGVGLNVIRAIASYAGQPVKLIRDGRPATAYGLTETMRYTIAPPGHLPLKNIRFSLVDVPDLQALPPLWPGLQSIWMGAGPVP